MKNKYGFVYIWRDKKYKRFYIGCHWGTEDDGYICSSSWMYNSFKRRREDFKRRILKRFYIKKEMYDEEYRILNLIKEEELGIKYYNHAIFHAEMNEKSKYSKERNRKVSESNKGKKKSDIHIKKYKEYQSSRPQEHTDKIIKSRIKNGKDKGLIPVKSIITGERTRLYKDDLRYISGEFISNAKGLKQSKDTINNRVKKITGKIRTQESIEKYRICGKENNKLARHSERKWYHNSFGEKMRLLITDIIPDGFVLGMQIKRKKKDAESTSDP